MEEICERVKVNTYRCPYQMPACPLKLYVDDLLLNTSTIALESCQMRCFNFSGMVQQLKHFNLDIYFIDIYMYA